jgi:hypothetical protein
MSTLGTAALVGDAIVAELGGAGPVGGWPLAFAASRLWMPLLSLSPGSTVPQLAGTQISVVPDAMPTDERLTRALQRQVYEYFLLVQAKVNDQSDASIDPLANLLEVVKDWFFRDQHVLATGPTARCVAASFPTMAWRPHLEMFAYTGVAALSFEVDQ